MWLWDLKLQWIKAGRIFITRIKRKMVKFYHLASKELTFTTSTRNKEDFSWLICLTDGKWFCKLGVYIHADAFQCYVFHSVSLKDFVFCKLRVQIEFFFQVEYRLIYFLNKNEIIFLKIQRQNQWASFLSMLVWHRHSRCFPRHMSWLEFYEKLRTRFWLQRLDIFIHSCFIEILINSWIT